MTKPRTLKKAVALLKKGSLYEAAYLLAPEAMREGVDCLSEKLGLMSSAYGVDQETVSRTLCLVDEVSAVEEEISRASQHKRRAELLG